jgi:hypothetical protein
MVLQFSFVQFYILVLLPQRKVSVKKINLKSNFLYFTIFRFSTNLPFTVHALTIELYFKQVTDTDWLISQMEQNFSIFIYILEKHTYFKPIFV